MRTLTQLLILLYALTGMSCTAEEDEKADFIADAKHFCEIHDITYWEKTGMLEELDKLDISERQIAIYKAIESSVKTPEMKAAIKLDRETTQLSEYYQYLQTEIPKLTGQPFDCPPVKAYYTPGNPSQ